MDEILIPVTGVDNDAPRVAVPADKGAGGIYWKATRIIE